MCRNRRMSEEIFVNQSDYDLLPRLPGVYRFYDKENTLMYIGKALSLKDRVSSYFKNDHLDRPHIIPMIPKIVKIGYISTTNEVESLILEAALIKQYQPKYNIELKDDKSFAWIYISTNEQFPKVKVVRSITKTEYQKGKLFGPYPDGSSVRRVYRYLRKVFPFCNCKSKEEEEMYYQIELCAGPNIGKINKEDYREIIKELISVLQGKRVNIINRLQKEMDYLAKNEKFEEAALLRDKINDLKYVSRSTGLDLSTNELQYSAYKQEKLNAIAKQLEIDHIKRIECYDISHQAGKNGYGSMVVSVDGYPRSEMYRSFKINIENTGDDYSSLREVIQRRLRLIEDKEFGDIPDLIVIDGGPNQLLAIYDIVNKYNNIGILGISKGRKYKRKGSRLHDEFWIYDKLSLNTDSLTPKIRQINLRNPEIIASLRDEAHRFVIKLSRNAKRKGIKKSVYDEISGVGPQIKKILKQKYQSPKDILKTSVEELTITIKNRSTAINIMNYLSTKYKSNKS